MDKRMIIGFLLILALSACGSSEPQIVTGTGDITSVVDQYRGLLGADNGGDPGTKGVSGYREIN